MGDAPFWHYASAELNRFTDRLELCPVDCENWTPPAKIVYTLDPTSRAILEKMVGVPMVSFNDNVYCDPCVVVSFNATCLERCAAPRTGQHFLREHKEAMKEGGSCAISQILTKKLTLQDCMASPKADQFASC